MANRESVRLDRFLADAGAGSRSDVKKYIRQGLVKVNGTPVRQPDLKVGPQDNVELNSLTVGKAPEHVYYLLNKPAGYLSATRDRQDPTVLDLLPKEDRRELFPVGRLDKDTEGLLLITDDGPLAHALTSPARHVPKTYYAVVKGLMTSEDIQRFESGLDIGEKSPSLPAVLRILHSDPENGKCEVHITVCEGKFHQVKRMVQAVGKEVVYLKRISMGTLKLPEDLPVGQWICIPPETFLPFSGS